MVAPFPDRPSSVVASPDGARIAVFSAPAGDDVAAGGAAPLLLLHGTTADHRTWRVLAPMLVARGAVHAIDRRGRGDSTDADGEYAIARELEDVVAVAGEISAAAGGPVDVLGHSLGGRIALGATLLTPSIRRVVVYESAPRSAVREPGARDGLLEALRGDLVRGDNDQLLARFMTEAVGMPAADLAAFRRDPIWPLRAAAAPTIIRELEASEAASEISIEMLARVRVPVLQVVGSASPSSFRQSAELLDARLANGRMETIDGARHAAHHSHPVQLLRLVEGFLAS